MRKSPQRTTLQDFFKACEALRNHREIVERMCHSKNDIVHFIKSKLPEVNGFTTDSAEKALESVGITLTTKAPKRKKDSANAARTLAKSLLELYERLGETPPPTLVELTQRLMHGVSNLEEPAINNGKPNITPIPMSSVPPLKTVAVVTPDTRPNHSR